MTNFNVGTLAELRAALATSATDNVADTITLTADISGASTADFTAGAGGNDLLKIAITDGQTLSIVGGGHTLDANYFGRVLEVSGGTVAISDLTIREGGLSGNGGDNDHDGGSALGAGIYNTGNLTLTNVTVTANAASGGGAGGMTGNGYGGSGGGGGGGLGSVAGAGGAGTNYHGGQVFAGAAAMGGTGGRGADSYGGTGGGGGGASTGGGGGLLDATIPQHGGGGGTAAIGGFSIGGGGGGSGSGSVGDSETYGATSGKGGAAVGGIYSTGTLALSGSTVSGNIAAGGGGAGTQSLSAIIDGGTAVGGVRSTGTLTLDDSSSITGNAAAGGKAGSQGIGHDGRADNDQRIPEPNQPHTGGISLVGLPATPTEGGILAAVSTLADADGLGQISYQWTSDGTPIAGATSDFITLTSAQAGHVIAVTATYVDGAGFTETATSPDSATVAWKNTVHTGTVTISGTVTQGQVLTANTGALADADGLGTISYQWKSGGTNISGATDSTFTLTHAQVGHPITVTASYTDGHGFAESATSTGTANVANLNTAPTGAVTISGVATQGQVLTAVTSTLADADGLGTIHYQWKSDATVINGATSSTLTLGQDQVGHAITVTASYTDGGGTAESVASTATAAVANVNDAPTGAVTISGTATLGQVLTANTGALADADGLGTIHYQWKSDGADISGATSSTLTLGQAQIGHAITVTASYTDGGGTAESVDSAGTALVANINHLPTGAVTISGAATQGQVLTASNTLADADGLGTIHYQWKADGTDISGATGSTLTLDQTEVGHAITVAASYTDGFGAAESVTSTASAAVIGVAPPPPSDPSPPAPVTSVGTVDGASVSTTTTTAADGSQTHVIAVEPTGHPDPGAGGATADIPLVSVGDSHLITVGVPTGTGFSASGSVAPGSASSASPALVGSIHTGASAADQQQMDDGANDFLHLHSTAPVLAQTITLTGAHADTPFAINGLADSGTVTAVVIDTHNVAGQSVLTLDNVDFAAVIGEAHITGGAGSQTVYADSAPQYMVLGADDDVLHGGGGADTVGSIGGDDSIFGDDGDDYVFGGIGNDAVYGGAGDDAVQGNQGDDVVQGNAGNDHVYGGQGDDLVYGGQGDDVLSGDLGNDRLFGNLGNDTLTGGDGDDVVQGNQGDDSVQGGAGNDLVYGGQGADSVDGGQGDDQLWGDLGDDVLHGGPGNDTMTGGAGADTFLYAKGDGADRITDFHQSEGDHIQLTGAHGAYTTAQVGADTVVDFGNGESIVLANVQLSSLTTGWITG